ncbi:MAG TPA: 6-phosphogluconolactonase [Candidatus Angelobacter sp.]|nr:6-phosphogluconolactonase [Candidatus Angelobacter sp.]
MQPSNQLRVDQGELKVAPDAAALMTAAMQEFVQCAEKAIAANRAFSVALSGGNTPRSVFSLLAEKYKDSLPWTMIHIFFGDERHVPPDDPESNYRMARESLLSKVPIPEQNVHRVHAELPAQQAASEYEQQLRSYFHFANNDRPRFDLIMLGVGEEGHTASLFPDSTALHEQARLVVANWVEKFHTWRITFTFPVLNQAAEVLFLASGAGKAEILKNIFDVHIKNAYPAQLVRPTDGRLLWLIDQAAAALL